MRLTRFSDYALRILLYAASFQNGQRATIEDTAARFDISVGHLKKVVMLLTQQGYLEGVRGRSGGFRLARRPEDIRLGAVLRVTEPDFGLVECFVAGNTCHITPHCRLPMVLNRALAAFLAECDRYSLADMQLGAADFLGAVAQDHRLRGPRLQPATDPADPER